MGGSAEFEIQAEWSWCGSCGWLRDLADFILIIKVIPGSGCAITEPMRNSTLCLAGFAASKAKTASHWPQPDFRSEINLKKPINLQKKGLKELISSLILQETQIKVALSGFNLKEPVRVVFDSSPLFGPVSNILLHKQDRNPRFSCRLVNSSETHSN